MTGDPESALHPPFQHHEYIASVLPFSPAAINDAGLIVGDQQNRAVQFHNGAVETLALNVAANVASAAVDVTSLGAIVGKTGDINTPAVLWWPLTWPLPPAPVGVFVPAAMNKNLTIVGSSLDAQVAFRWMPSVGYEGLAAPDPFRSHPTFAHDVNDHGLIVGIVTQQTSAFPIIWSPPDNTPRFPWPSASVRGRLHINTSGDVGGLDSGRNVCIFRSTGMIQSFPSIPDPQSVDGISDEGRLIGTSRVNGVLRGWTFYKDQLTFLDPVSPDANSFVQPTGVNTCGNIVGRVMTNLAFAGGILYAKQFPFRCDGAIVVHP